jgi:2-desacetyl-2-hydroxyethyl bacteriochlorophyllide A dehydrogenase
MRSVQVTGVDQIEWVEVPDLVCGPKDVLLKMKACGICGSDAFYAHMGGIPPNQGKTRLGHEPAAEVVEVGSEVAGGIAVGDHVVIDTMAFADGLLGSGGNQGGLQEYVLVLDFQPGKQLRSIPKEIPWEVAALNEPMAVAKHGVNKSGAKAGDKVVVFGAGPIGLGATISYKALGCDVVVVDIIPSRLEKALKVGADAVVNSAEEDLGARLRELHGEIPGRYGQPGKAGSDIYYDAAGVPSVVQNALALMKPGGTLTIVAVHKQPVEIDFGALLTTEPTINMAMGYPTEIFEVTDDIINNWQKYELIISHRFPYDDALEALQTAATPGAADKVSVLF